MNRLLRPCLVSLRLVYCPSRTFHSTTATQAATHKRAGDISDAFSSLSGQEFAPLEPEYASIKAQLIAGNEDKVVASWRRLLAELNTDVERVKRLGSSIVPEIDFKDVESGTVSGELLRRYKETGIAVIRGVVDEQEAKEWKDGLSTYIKENPQTKAFPAHNPQVFELYWSRAQLLARAHPNLLHTSRFLMSLWHTTSSTSTPLSTKHPLTYADRLRIRLPGDTSFALGPHIDGGSVERWHPSGYGGRTGVYSPVWRGNWESFDPWDAEVRLRVVSDLHAGVGACSAFRMSQGWLALSTARAGQGSLRVNPLLVKTTAYFLLRPFFRPLVGHDDPTYLHADNWALEHVPSAWLHGAAPGRGMELSPALHPHLQLASTMVAMPDVQPGDYVAWHCDTVHAVDAQHTGTSDASVLYIPACPLTEANARYLVRQRAAFVSGEPSPDFGGGGGEGAHVGRVQVAELEGLIEADGRRAVGLEMWDGEEEGLTPGEREVCWRANKILGYYD